MCMSGDSVGESAYSIKINTWNHLVKICYLADPKSAHCRAVDIDSAFVATNYEEAGNDDLNDENDDQALMRFEFLEILCRVAIMKYGMGEATHDAAEALEMMLSNDVIPGLPPECFMDPDLFRRERLYCKATAHVLEEHERLLQACYDFFKAADAVELMGMEHWLKFTDAAGLTSAVTRSSMREAKLIFGWSQMRVVNEIKNRHRVYSMTYIDFLEAVGRMADLISPPTKEELAAFFAPEGPTTDTPTWEYFQTVSVDEAELKCHESAEFGAAPTVPLHVKLAQICEVIQAQLMQKWDARTPTALVKQLDIMTVTVGGRKKAPARKASILNVFDIMRTGKDASSG
ncbi:hypothetical protein CYMTET_35174 [Cymbomonas tetramitiformis]|uniref:Flagellar associated protein n=1 Tax=Cymbomonas tetramitiformis TaxID=36881 RepID=A0AAE0F9L7_9CHLO|nr:hypothetical protein CYMTET_35174 [Cymbomonas tetramitiformis]